MNIEKTNNSLVEATKTEMQYIEQANTCKRCTYSKLEEDKYVDRSWTRTCTFSNLCSFVVKDESSCRYFESMY